MYFAFNFRFAWNLNVLIYRDLIGTKPQGWLFIYCSIYERAIHIFCVKLQLVIRSKIIHLVPILQSEMLFLSKSLSIPLTCNNCLLNIRESRQPVMLQMNFLHRGIRSNNTNVKDHFQWFRKPLPARTVRCGRAKALAIFRAARSFLWAALYRREGHQALNCLLGLRVSGIM